MNTDERKLGADHEMVDLEELEGETKTSLVVDDPKSD